MKRLNEYSVPAILIAKEESSLICDTINSEEPGKYWLYIILST